MLALNAVDIAVIISSLIASLCFTFANHSTTFFSSSSSALVSGDTSKSLRPKKEWPTDRPSEWIRARSLNSYFAFYKIVVKSPERPRNFYCVIVDSGCTLANYHGYRSGRFARRFARFLSRFARRKSRFARTKSRFARTNKIQVNQVCFVGLT